MCIMRFLQTDYKLKHGFVLGSITDEIIDVWIIFEKGYKLFFCEEVNLGIREMCAESANNWSGEQYISKRTEPDKKHFHREKFTVPDATPVNLCKSKTILLDTRNNKKYEKLKLKNSGVQ